MADLEHSHGGQAHRHVLREGVPPGFSVRAVEEDLEHTIDSVEDIHHFHAWSITEERPMVTLHARIREGADAEATVLAIKNRLADRLGIAHATIETEHGTCADAQLDFDPDTARRETADHRGHDHHYHDHEHPAPALTGRAPV